MPLNRQEQTNRSILRDCIEERIISKSILAPVGSSRQKRNKNTRKKQQETSSYDAMGSDISDAEDLADFIDVYELYC